MATVGGMCVDGQNLIVIQLRKAEYGLIHYARSIINSQLPCGLDMCLYAVA